MASLAQIIVECLVLAAVIAANIWCLITFHGED